MGIEDEIQKNGDGNNERSLDEHEDLSKKYRNNVYDLFKDFDPCDETMIYHID